MTVQNSALAVRIAASCQHALARFARAKDGVAAIEFAMIVPIMVMLFLGAAEFSQAISADRRVTQVASSTADLVARSKTTTASEIQSVLGIVSHLMPAPTYDASKLKITILSVEASIDNAATTTVGWSCNHNGGVNSYTNGQSYSLPTGVVDKGDSVVVAEVEYQHVPPVFGYFIKSNMTLKEKFYLKPRLSSKVTFSGSACT